MKIYLCVFVILINSCSPKNDNEDQTTETSDNKSSATIQDSLSISQSEEYIRLIQFLNWYKAGHDKLYLPRIQKEVITDTSYYAYVDTLVSKELISLYRKSGYFSSEHLKKDSLYIEEAKDAYAKKDLEIYDYFDHDFILLTQETKETLEAIPNTYILADHCDMESKRIAVSIGGYVNLKFTFIKEHGQIRINEIENIGRLD